VASGALLLAACGGGGKPNASSSGSTASTSVGGQPRHGGTAVYAEGAQGHPNYIFPVVSSEYNSVANQGHFINFMWVPLYVMGTPNGAGLNEAKSMAFPPVYSNHDKTVTIKLKHWQWSDGRPVTSRDLLFFMNLIEANKAVWGHYAPGQIPDNVVSYKATGPYTFVMHLNASYDPIWFTDDQLSLLMALPQHAWDKTSKAGRVGNYDKTTAGAKAVYKFLSGQASDLSTYSSNPLWQVVDGPWKLQSFQSDGQAVFVPNSRYSGPHKAYLSTFKEVPFTSDSAEFNSLAAGDVTVGYLPNTDIKDQSRLTAAGYHMVRSAEDYINFLVLNFHNPVTGPLVRQLYIREALQRVMDEKHQIKSILLGIGGHTDYGPVPPEMSSPYESSVQASGPYQFSTSAARKLLTSHGWTIPGSGPAVCTKPGPGPGECGAGINKGQRLQFDLVFASGSSYLTQEMENYKSDAAQAGIVISLRTTPFQSVISTVLPCSGKSCSNSWQMGNWGINFAWDYGDGYPLGSEIFGSGNYINYSSKKMESLISAALHAPRAEAVAAMKAYDTYLTKQLPVIWQLATYKLQEVSDKLGGVSFYPTEYLTPEDWYYTR
jgi:peptide/nickel transport system substrate-binding protein